MAFLLMTSVELIVAAEPLPPASIDVSVADFSSPECVYDLYCRAIKANDLRTARTCVADNALAWFEDVVVFHKMPKFQDALKVAAELKPGKFIRKLASANGSRAIMVYIEGTDATIGVVCRRPIDICRWVISSWEGDWHDAPDDDASPAEDRSRGVPSADNPEKSVGLARGFCKVPGATVRWYYGGHFNYETTVRLKEVEFKKNVSLLDEKSEQLAMHNPIIFPQYDLIILLLIRRDAQREENLVIRAINVKTRTTAWEIPWPIEAPEVRAIQLGAAGLSISGNDLLIVPQGRTGTAMMRLDAKTGVKKSLMPILPAERTNTLLIGTLPDGREIWQSQSSFEAPKLNNLADSAEIDKSLDLRLHIGKAGDKPADIMLQSLAPNDHGNVTVLGIAQNGLLLLKSAQKDRTSTLMAFNFAEKQTQWERKINAPVLSAQFSDKRLIVSCGEIIATRQPVMVEFNMIRAIHVISTETGDIIYSRENAKKNAVNKTAFVEFLGAHDAIDLFRGVAGTDDTSVWAGLDAKSGNVLWQSTHAYEHFAATDTDGQALAFSPPSGITIDMTTGRQLNVVRFDGAGDREYPVNIGKLWLLSASILESDVTELVAREPSRMELVEDENVIAARKLTPLHEAVFNGDLAKVKEIVKTNPEWIGTHDPGGMTPLFSAAINAQTEIVKFLLLQKADVNAMDKNDRTPLLVLASQPYKEATAMAALLLESGAQIDSKELWTGATPLHFAIKCGRTDFVKLLIERGSDSKVGDLQGETPLHYAVREGRLDVVELLVQHKAQVGLKSKNGKTPIDLAREAQNSKIETILLSYSRDLEK